MGNRTNNKRSLRRATAVVALLGAAVTCTSAFAPSTKGAGHRRPAFTASKRSRPGHSTTTTTVALEAYNNANNENGFDTMKRVVASGALAVSLMLSATVQPVYAENELNDKYGGGLDTSLVDQTCLVDKCSLQAKACLADDPSCRKGLTCTAKCLGDNACITGCKFYLCYLGRTKMRLCYL